MPKNAFEVGVKKITANTPVREKLYFRPTRLMYWSGHSNFQTLIQNILHIVIIIVCAIQNFSIDAVVVMDTGF